VGLAGFDREGKTERRAAQYLEPVLALLSQHGPDRLITGGEICAQLGIAKTEHADATSVVRAVVSQLRIDGHPIISTSTGYGYARRPEDLDSTIEHLQNRETRISRARHAIERARYKMATAGIPPAQRKLFA
jgi:hypothetical protein